MRQTTWQHRFGAWAVVTGASSGIGRAVALEAARRGLNVVLAARSAAALEEVAAEARTRGVEARTCAQDLGTASGTDALLRDCAELDIGLLVTAAGFGTSGPFGAATLADEEAMLALNCGAVLRQAHHFAGRFAAQRRGGIMLFGSLVGWQGTPNAAHYAATKAYNQVLAEGLAAELAPHKVAVLAVAPGPVRSGFAARAGMEMGATVAPEAVARLALGALGRRTTVVPGGLSKLLTWSLAPLPRSGRTAILGRIMGGMTARAQAERSAAPGA